MGGARALGGACEGCRLGGIGGQLRLVAVGFLGERLDIRRVMDVPEMVEKTVL